ncbi:MAG TPA: ATP-binding protein, partial [Desulfosarcina sp.]|nr:ATP-binding protein [Desulfosarcina sp.]
PADIEIVQKIQADCGRVMADPVQLHQIAMNLITNAYHAVEDAREKKITVQLRETPVVQDDAGLSASTLDSGRYAVLSVADTGCGIDPAIVDKIFEPYFTTKSQGKGTGLGLAVVYGIVKEYGGDIRVSSEPGKETTFSVFIPLMEREDETIVPEDAEKVSGGTERVLLVDDEEAIVNLQRKMLERLGYQVTSRTSSLEALEAFKSNPDGFDLVITDMTMPNLTGDQFARKVKSIKADIPVIICTGFSERINKQTAETIGINGFLMKPVVKSMMAKMVRRILDGA